MWLSNSNAWWESGSSSQRHKRRKCPQNHITLPFFFLNCNISLSGEDALLSLVCLLSSCFCFMSFSVSSPQLSFSLISPPHLFFPLFTFPYLFLEKTCIRAASLGVCFHIGAQEKCRFCSKVTELSCRFLQFLSSYSVCECILATVRYECVCGGPDMVSQN